MKRMEPQKNEGWTGDSYDFGFGEKLNRKVGATLSEACHIFYYQRQWSDRA